MLCNLQDWPKSPYIFQKLSKDVIIVLEKCDLDGNASPLRHF